ncbi:right-handed parallel beta-helix repeat-containing protein [Tamlana sp. 62-3]|uniref:Right-handed parallel beta-helix repeat-containing protein n=1 Tax=Neotamlana sargassicola TaxID=2883125 RepID=A0A9X1I6U1_9FLAO|nr:right-handed parallel beta-helix repeat-containing protein [Tamlana sargassicola]MCB4808916.1 right-handed parallel beta-helix repeat-containing protein [Tamlana sargassicola]
MNNIKHIVFAIVFLSFNLNAQHKIYISPTGNDTNSGTKTKPLATLTGARNAIRLLKENQSFKTQAFTVIVKDGLYVMKAPFELFPEDSGTEKHPIIYKAEEGAHPVFSGGKTISNFTETENGLWQTKVPESVYYNWKFDQLYVNNNRATLAKTPNQGFIKIDTVFQNIWKQGKSKVAERAEQIIYLDSNGAKALQNIKPNELKNVRFKAYHKWDYTLRHIDDFIADSSKIVTSGKGMKPWNPLKKDRRIILENYEAALDAPGEWFLKDNGILLYKPKDGEIINNTEFIAPVLGNLITIAGNASENKYVQYINFEGLSFKHCHYKIPPTGSEPNQAAAILNAAILVENAKHINVSNCEVSNVGQHAVWFGKGCSYSSINKTYIHNIGGGGVYLGDFKPLQNELHTHHISVENNIIKSGGQEFPAAVGVWVGHSSDNIVTHNDIGNFFYTGVSVGWVWGYKPSLAKRNTISYNHIHHIGWDLLSDMAGIYTLGASEGTVVENNLIHHIHSYSYGGWGMYADEGSTGIVFKNNLVYSTKTGGFQQNYGKHNVVKNNILAFAKKYQLQCTIPEKHKSFTFTNNIVIFNEGMVAKGAWDTVVAEIDKNIYWNTSSTDYNFNEHNFEEWKALGFDKHSLITKPYFKDTEAFNFSFKRKKNYKKIGFKPFNYSEAGIYGDAAWIEKSKLKPEITEAFDKAVETNMKMKIKR